VRLTLSGANPGDTKKRQAWLRSPMAFPRIVPHSDGAGVIEAVGLGADLARVSQRAWVYGAQSYRPFGTAARTTVVPEALASTSPPRSVTRWGMPGCAGIVVHPSSRRAGALVGLLSLTGDAD
jgi:NADPH2:quinone reductase